MNELPEPVIHHILSFLPADGGATKQVTRLNLLSKWWTRACCSYQVLDFCETCSYDTPQNVEKSQRFIGFVDKTMTRYRDNNTVTRIQKLKLHIVFEMFTDTSYISELAILLDKWINIGLDKQVPHLDLRIRVRYVDFNLRANLGPDAADIEYCGERYDNWRYHIPTRAVSLDTVKSLSLGWQVCLPRSWEDDPHDLSLHTLELYQVLDLKDQNAFQRLIRACPGIQKLTVDTQLDEIKLCGLNNLKMVSIRRRYVISYTIINKFKLKIEAPSLETLCLSDLGRGRDRYEYYTTSIDLDCCNLRCLNLTTDCTMNDDQFHRFLSRLPLLETLQLQDCSLINNISIANPMLKKLELKFGHLWKILSVQISSPKLVYFRCETTSGKRFPSILANNCPRYVEVVFKDTTHPLHLYSYWFRKLRESVLGLKSDNNHTSISFNYIWEKESLEEKELVPTRLPACKIDNLNLTITANSPSYPVILSRLFSTFHPATLQVSDTDNGQGHKFLQFVCENLANRGNISSCSACVSRFKCWKHQLKDVKIQGVKGRPRENEDLDWGTMLKQLSTLTIGHNICFRLRLQWAT